MLGSSILLKPHAHPVLPIYWIPKAWFPPGSKFPPSESPHFQLLLSTVVGENFEIHTLELAKYELRVVIFLPPSHLDRQCLNSPLGSIPPSLRKIKSSPFILAPTS